eukprot:TRINITY_DN2289_c0_g1_i1.p1 TRINITY_DN2289_c0_g1~~TRINITY_DN2289_c0_g1_i1.p1  ORF type:complete len:462 (+),score=158.38 TRINITY_DN2289_c0_g1_i1:85-1470(+)
MPKNPRVYVDIAIGSRAGGRVVFELFVDVTPRTAENFRGLCTGEYGKGQKSKKLLTYEGCSIFRASKGGFLQGGDFQFNNGDGGESIYGGTFNDEDFSRRHTQAGVLSMANKGRNSNGSQFFVTLKRQPQLDNRHVAFGQVVEGMDVIRAIAQVPTDLDERPRVPVKIVGCGEVDRLHKSQADPTTALAQQIDALNEDAAPTKVKESVKGRAILAGKTGGAAGGNEKRQDQGDEESDHEEKMGATAPPRNERERRLFELRMKMNQGRQSNSKEVVEEQKRQADPDYQKKQEKRKLAEEKEDKDVMTGKAQPSVLPKEKNYMADTVESAEQRDKKKKKGNPDAFGWDVFNQESLMRAHDKRLKDMVFDEKAYKEQEANLADATVMYPGHDHKPSEEAKDRLQKAMDKSIEKSKAFSRRRATNPEEDCNYVNDRNRHFNKKMERYFGAYTMETRQNLERGTAL